MAKTRRPPQLIPTATLLGAYSRGVFPMAEERDDEQVFWIDPEWRGILPLDQFHVPARLRRRLRRRSLTVTVDTAFAQVIAACAAPGLARSKTWINRAIERSYIALHAQGGAHSVEVFDGPILVGGLYGVSIGAAFFGESMFSRASDASKIALVHLVVRLKAGGYRLLDTQFVTEHLAQFGAIEISRARYHKLLKQAIALPGRFYELGGAGAAVGAGVVLQAITQTS